MSAPSSMRFLPRRQQTTELESLACRCGPRSADLPGGKSSPPRQTKSGALATRTGAPALPASTPAHPTTSRTGGRPAPHTAPFRRKIAGWPFPVVRSACHTKSTTGRHGHKQAGREDGQLLIQSPSKEGPAADLSTLPPSLFYKTYPQSRHQSTAPRGFSNASSVVHGRLNGPIGDRERKWQAEREGGLFLILHPPFGDQPVALSGRPLGLPHESNKIG